MISKILKTKSLSRAMFSSAAKKTETVDVAKSGKIS